MAAKKSNSVKVENLTHKEEQRINLPSPELQAILPNSIKEVKTLRYPRNPDLDPQMVWRGKDLQDWSDLVVAAPPLFIQERIHPKAIIEDLNASKKESQAQLDLFADFNGLPEGADKTDFYQHQGHWTNRMILGDSLQVMASLAEREELRGKVQCIYFDPPYGIKFNSNFQWSTTTRDVKDGKADHISREPEMVKAFRDTWRDGIHSYLSYIRDRLTVARDLLTDSGSIFVQIGDENVHRVRAVLDEIFGDENFINEIIYKKTGSQGSKLLAGVNDYILWFAKDKKYLKYREIHLKRESQDFFEDGFCLYNSENNIFKEKDYAAYDLKKDYYRMDPLQSENPGSRYEIFFEGKGFYPKGYWKTSSQNMDVLLRAGRIISNGKSLSYKRKANDVGLKPLNNLWIDTGGAGDRTYVVQTGIKPLMRCILMATDPGDLVLDPTCGSGTTAYVAEQWGRRWITIDTSRVALALARARLMGARYPWYILADSPEGKEKEMALSNKAKIHKETYNRISLGFVYERVPHITLKSIANNTEIDTIYDKFQNSLEPIRLALNELLNTLWEEWEIPRETGEQWSQKAKELHHEWWKLRIARQKEIDTSIAKNAEYEYLYDRPYEDNKRLRVAGPFTVESLQPHRVLGLDENDEFVDHALGLNEPSSPYKQNKSFAELILENIKTAGVQYAHKEDKINFLSVEPWPGANICAIGTYLEGEQQKKAGILIGPEYGNLNKAELVEAAIECGQSRLDTLISFAFNYDSSTTELNKVVAIPIIKARMNTDLQMGDYLKNTGKGNLFVVFGDPEIELTSLSDNQIQLKIKGIDMFNPSTGEVKVIETKEIACWFIDTNYNSEAFFVRHAYFIGAGDPYKSLKSSLKAEISEETWSSLNSEVSRPFPKPSTKRIAVKVINHLGDEVMKVIKVE